MKRLIRLIFFLAAIFPHCLYPQTYQYPFTKIESVIDTFHNSYVVEDKYRWLENVNSEEAKEWIKEQNKYSNKFLNKIRNEYDAYNKIDKYAYYETKYLKKVGNYYFNFFVLSGSGTSALFCRKKITDDPEILVDPNSISVKDKVVLKDYSVSGDSELLAYQFSRNGSDREELKVIDISSGFHKKDHLTNLRFSHNVAWKGDGFFYSKYAETDYYDKTPKQEVFFHKIETEQSEDKLIFSRDNPGYHFGYFTTSDERYFILTEHTPEKKINVYYIDYNSDKPALKALFTNFEDKVHLLENHKGRFIAETTINSEKGSIVEINPEQPYEWRAIAPQFRDAILTGVFPLDDRIIAVYRSDIQPSIIVYDYEGNILRNIRLPVGTSVGGFSGTGDEKELLYYYTSYTLPKVVYKFNPKTFEQDILESTKINFDYTIIEYKAVEYISKDSTAIPMILVYEKGLNLNGKNPTLLKAYGGFGISESPAFDPGIVYFVKKGGVFAFAKVRGGGDKGEDWAEQGKGANKQNTFDDFISAAEYLIREGYTSSAKLAATGGSNGGLVVAAAAIQRPDLFKAVVPIVAPLDMLRFDKFTVGHFWSDEYGNVKDSMGFKLLYSYSPYHNIKNDINYPSMLIMTSDADDRVPPFHSYKFAALMQNRTAQTNPVILRTEKKAGHYGSSTLYTYLDEEAGMYGFIMKELMEE